MKKLLVLFVVLALTACSANAEEFSKEYIQSCYDMGGLMGSRGCVQQQSKAQAEQDNPVSPVSNNPAGDSVSESTTLKLGQLGSYHAVLDSNVGKWTLGIWPEAQITAGEMTLADLKIKGATIQFVMPFDGVVNNSAGTVTVDDQQWTLGNPIQDSSGNTLVAKGALVTISYGTNNDSAGFQIWFK